MLLIFSVVTFSPYIITSLVGLIVGLENVPSDIYTTALILFLLNNVTNSIIQSYFRRDLRDCIAKYSIMFSHNFKMHCFTKFHKGDSQSKAERAVPEINVPDDEDKKSDTIQKSQTYLSGVQYDITGLSVNAGKSLDQDTTVAVSMETIDTNLNGDNSANQSVNSLQVLDSELSPQHSNDNETDITVNCSD